MTREEAIKILRREIECLSHTKCEDCILEAACDPARTTPFDSEYIEVYEMAIKALEQESKTDVLDKIRAEIEQEYNRLSATRADETLEVGECLGLKMALKIIDKYTAKSEDKE